jgi:membrane associated rhomboid family serine protease
MTPWVQRLLIANVMMLFVTEVSPVVAGQLAFVPVYAASRPWTLVTYMFLHAGWMHLIFNMIGLYFFGPRLEDRLGGRQFLLLYFLSGIAGAILHVTGGIAVTLLSVPFNPWVPMVGASGAVFGVLMGFALYWPRERIYIWGVLPVEARVLDVGQYVEEVPLQHRNDPAQPEWGFPVKIEVPPKLLLRPGEAIEIIFPRRAKTAEEPKSGPARNLDV